MKPPVRTIIALVILAITPFAGAQRRIVVVPDSGKPKDISIDAVFDGAKLWSHTDATLEAAWKDKGFKWLSSQVKDHGSIRRDNWGFQQVKLSAFGGKNVEEVGFLLKGGKLSEVSIAIWNKGDSQNAEISDKDFNAIVEDWCAELNRRVAPKFDDLGKDKSSAARAERRRWVGKDLLAQLEYSGIWDKAVSYTHLTLPTIYSV